MTQQTEIVQAETKRKAMIVVTDDSPFANLLDTGKFEHLYRVAQMFAGSMLIPEAFRNKPADCFVAIQMAIRLNVDPLMLLQNTYVVHGKPGIEAKLAIALVNSSGLFSGSLEYETDGGEDPWADKYRCRAFATKTGTKAPLYGPWVDWRTVKAEGWDAKPGSKWKTLPSLMFRYRAATFFARLYCPERLMGMQTAEELQDVEQAYRQPGNVTVLDLPSAAPVEDAATTNLREECRKALAELSKSKGRETAMRALEGAKLADWPPDKLPMLMANVKAAMAVAAAPPVVAKSATTDSPAVDAPDDIRDPVAWAEAVEAEAQRAGIPPAVAADALAMINASEPTAHAKRLMLAAMREGKFAWTGGGK